MKSAAGGNGIPCGPRYSCDCARKSGDPAAKRLNFRKASRRVNGLRLRQGVEPIHDLTRRHGVLQSPVQFQANALGQTADLAGEGPLQLPEGAGGGRRGLDLQGVPLDFDGFFQFHANTNNT